MCAYVIARETCVYRMSTVTLPTDGIQRAGGPLLYDRFDGHGAKEIIREAPNWQ